MRAFIVGSIVLAGGVSGSLAGVQAADPPRVTVAIVRADGILIPFATRIGRRWSNTWPTPSKRAEVPVRISDVPQEWWGKAGPAAEWHAWFIAGGTARATVDRLAWYPAHCDRGIGLQSDGRERSPATAHDVALPEARARRHRPAVAVLLQAAPRPARRDSRRTAAPRPARRGAVPPPLRGCPPLPRRDRRAVRRCAAPTRLRRHDVRRRLVHLGRRRRPEETVRGHPAGVDDGAQGMLPLGYLTDERETTWIAQLTSWERERYVVVRASPRRKEPDIALITHGGGCGSS
jgi:hypothetical protein